MSVLEKASDLIDCLGQAGEPVTLGHVREALGMPKSSTHRLLGELAALGIVRRTEDGRYSLGPRLLYWGEAAADTFDLRAVADQPMRRLRDRVARSVRACSSGSTTRASASLRSRDATSCGRSSSSAGPFPFALAQRASSCWRSRMTRCSGSSCSAPLPTPRGCRMHRDRAYRSSWSAFGRNAGRPRWENARRVSLRWLPPSSTHAIGSSPPSVSPHPPRGSGARRSARRCAIPSRTTRPR